MQGNRVFLGLTVVLCLAGQAAASVDILYDRVFSGKELNDEVLAGHASYPASPFTSISGSRLDITTSLVSSVLFRMTILEVGASSAYSTLSAGVFIDYAQLTSDNDLGIAISDGTQILGAMRGDHARVWTLDGLDTGASYFDDYVPSGYLDDGLPLTVLMEPGRTPTSSMVTVTNNVGASLAFSGFPPIDYDGRLDFILIGDDVGEQYGIDSVRITVSGEPVPVPGAIALALFGLGCLPFAKRHLR